MAATSVKLPLRNDLPWYAFTLVLSGVTYTFTFRYNLRMARWLMALGDAVDAPLVMSIPLLIGRNLLGRFNADDLLPGFFFVTDDTGAESQPTRNSFGTTHSLWYEDPTGAT